ncbi:hypothetical protein T492DRAFT_1028107 [Pavlovales sp. CCMP2436]|nr:hypothetical protein T492DRAFT_1028107 [Pavlovales sp. CCMP2436]
MMFDANLLARRFSARSGARRPSVHALLGICVTSSHAEVKRAYLSLAMRIHPDKVSHDEYESACERFVELQASYDSYENDRPRNFKRRTKVGDDENPLRQLFGVGCSWTDTEQERAERLDVQEQASHGLTIRVCAEPGSAVTGYISALPGEGVSSPLGLRTAAATAQADGGDTPR